MLSHLGFYSLVFSIFLVCIIFLSSRSVYNKVSKNVNIIYSLIFLQLFFVVFSFSCLVTAFLISDFSNITVYNNSHTTKPIFYKFSGVWGNHERKFTIMVISTNIFFVLFFVNSKKQDLKYKLLTVIFQRSLFLVFYFS